MSIVPDKGLCTRNKPISCVKQLINTAHGGHLYFHPKQLWHPVCQV